MAYLDRVRPLAVFGRLPLRTIGIRTYVDPDVRLTGTFLTTPTEAEVVTGGQEIILTLQNGAWAASGTLFDAQRQNIIDGFNSDGSEAGGWNAKVRDVADVSTVVRTDDTTVTITLPATADYSITANETITFTLPVTAIERGSGRVHGDVTFTVVAA